MIPHEDQPGRSALALDVDVINMRTLPAGEADVLKTVFDDPAIELRFFGQRPRGGGPTAGDLHLIVDVLYELKAVVESHGLEAIIGVTLGALYKRISEHFAKRPQLQYSGTTMTIIVDSTRYLMPKPPDLDNAMREIRADFESSQSDRRDIARAWVDGRWQTYKELGDKWPKDS